jgi:hypothetical protein
VSERVSSNHHHQQQQQQQQQQQPPPPPPPLQPPPQQQRQSSRASEIKKQVRQHRYAHRQTKTEREREAQSERKEGLVTFDPRRGACGACVRTCVCAAGPRETERAGRFFHPGPTPWCSCASRARTTTLPMAVAVAEGEADEARRPGSEGACRLVVGREAPIPTEEARRQRLLLSIII